LVPSAYQRGVRWVGRSASWLVMAVLVKVPATSTDGSAEGLNNLRRVVHRMSAWQNKRSGAYLDLSYHITAVSRL